MGKRVPTPRPACTGQAIAVRSRAHAQRASAKRVTEQLTSQSNQIGAAFADDSVGHMRIADITHGDRGYPGPLPNGRGKLHLVHGRRSRAWSVTTGADVNEIGAGLVQQSGRDRRVVHSVPGRIEIGSRDSNEQRCVRRDRRAYGLQDFARESTPCRDVAAAGVVTPVRQRRHEGADQITVRAMNLNGLIAGLDRPSRRCRECAGDLRNLVGRQCVRRLPALVKGHGAGRDRRVIPLPLEPGARLAAGVRELDSHGRA